jgi:hypothetical protein
MSGLRIQCSPLTKTIHAGRINKAGTAWTGEPVDVTSDVLGAVIYKVGAGNVIVVNENGEPAFEIEVRDVRKSGGL